MFTATKTTTLSYDSEEPCSESRLMEKLGAVFLVYMIVRCLNTIKCYRSGSPQLDLS